VSQPTPEQLADRGLGHLLREEGDEILEVAGVPGAGARPRHRFDADAAIAAGDATQPVLDEAALAADVEVAPAS
jgi:hypothetical protein